MLYRRVPIFSPMGKSSSHTNASQSGVDMGPSGSDAAVVSSSASLGPPVSVAREVGSKSKVRVNSILHPVVPECLKYEYIQMMHDPPEMGHMGIRKTKIAVKNNFFGME